MGVVRSFFRFVFNAYWKLFGGVWLALVWIAAGLITACSLIGFPLLPIFIKYAYVSYKPFGHSVVLIPGKNLFLGLVWALTAGALMAIVCLAGITVACVSIVGIPAVWQWFKIMRLALFPFSSYIT